MDTKLVFTNDEWALVSDIHTSSRKRIYARGKLVIIDHRERAALKLVVQREVGGEGSSKRVVHLDNARPRGVVGTLPTSFCFSFGTTPPEHPSIRHDISLSKGLLMRAANFS